MQNPIVWVQLGVRIRSFSIIKEATIHIVGIWNTLTELRKNSVIAKLRPLFEQKAKDLDEKKLIVEQMLTTYTPPHMKHEIQASNSVKEVGRNAYANNVLDWVALSFWRQWLLTAIINGAGRNGNDGGATLYACIMNGGESYLNVNEVYQFHTIYAMTVRGMTKFAECLRDLKQQLKEVVKGLMHSNLNLDLSRIPTKLNYLVCTEITKADIADVVGDEDMNLNWDEPIGSRQLPEFVPVDGSYNKGRTSLKRSLMATETRETLPVNKASTPKMILY
jgi:hypothetical protein